MGKQEVINTCNNYDIVFEEYKLLAMRRFKWNGLPSTISERHIERVLFENGMIAIVKDDLLGIIALPCFNSGEFNSYGESTVFRVTGLNYNKEFTDGENCVIIRNNDLSTNTSILVDLYTQRIVNIEQTADVNLFQQKHPYIVKTTKNQELTMKALLKKVSENEPVIIGDKELDLKGIEVFPILTPFLGVDLMDYKNQTKNELLTKLGINNANTDKKERLNGDEVNSNNQLIKLNFEKYLAPREESCIKLKEILGLDITVEARIVGGEEDGTLNAGDKGNC